MDTCRGLGRAASPGRLRRAPSCPREALRRRVRRYRPRRDEAAGAQDRGLARQDSRRDLADLVRLAARDDRVTGVRAALIAAHDVRLLGEQVDDLALPFVAPLRTDDYGRGHGWEVCLTLRL